MLSGFVQDQIEIVPLNLEITLGSKFLHNDFTGVEIQPSVRLAWKPDDAQTIWTAVSRAVRTPSRFDEDLTSFQSISAKEFESEEVIAYELGYRMRPGKKISFSLATFYNDYDKLRSFNMTGGPESRLFIGNDLKAKTWGLEASATALISNWWRLRGGCTFLHKEFTYKASNLLPQAELIESLDPNSQCILHSIMDVAKSFQIDVTGRYITTLPGFGPTIPAVPAYFALNARVAWAFKAFTIAIAGQNMLSSSHQEFGNSRIPNNIYGKISINL